MLDHEITNWYRRTMVGKRMVRVDREHQLWGWPGKRVCAYQKKGTIDTPFAGVRECWIICRVPFAKDWTLESIDTNLLLDQIARSRSRSRAARSPVCHGGISPGLTRHSAAVSSLHTAWALRTTLTASSHASGLGSGCPSRVVTASLSEASR